MRNTHTNHASEDKPLIFGLVLSSGFTVFEFLVGLFIGSLALMSDAGHNLAHTLCLGVSLFANKASRVEANTTHTFGFRRATTLAALLNAVILFLLAIYIFYEAIGRLADNHPTPPGLPIILVASIGILANGAIALVMRKRRGDLNMRSIFVGALVDTVGLIGTALGGLLILITKQPIIDPLISIFIGVLIVYAVWGIVSDAVHVLMEGVPEGVDPVKIKELILQLPSVKSLDHLHIWTLSSGHAALSCHVYLKDCSLEASAGVVRQIKEKLGEELCIEHCTIETNLIGA